MVLNTHYVYGLWLSLGWRKIFSVVVANVSRQASFMYARTIHGGSG